MQKTFKKRVAAVFAPLVKKHKWTLPFCYWAMAFIFIVHDALCYIGRNGKRCLSAVAVCVMFISTSSFSFPFLGISAEEPFVDALADEGDGPEEVISEEIISFVAETEEAVTDDDMEWLEHEVVMDGYDGSELENMDEVATYSLEDILEDREEYAIAETDSACEESWDFSEAVFDKEDWKLLLVNKQHPIPEGYTPVLGKISGSMQCDERIIPELLAMLQAAKEDGINLVICSPYRDLSHQEWLFNRKIDAYMKKGMSYMEAYKISSQAVMVPGASEHQLGLALDIVCDTYSSLTEGFSDTDAGKWLAEHSCEYGFILRYPKGKEYITSVEFEPWHFRYVGKDAATVIMTEEITLEEFVERLL